MSKFNAYVIRATFALLFFMAVAPAIFALTNITPVAQASKSTAMVPVAHYAIVTKADVTAATAATAQPGDGVIRITTRVCGTAANWQAVAAANNIRADSSPPYLVLLGQVLQVSCSGGPTVQPAPAAPASPQVNTQAGWADPLPDNTPFCNYWQLRTRADGTTYRHAGEDIPAGAGTPIRAAAAGTVSVGWQADGAGNYTMINHGGGVWTVYMHQSSFAVTSGWLAAGQIIGYVGSTGDSEGPHLHFEVQPYGLWNGTTSPAIWMRNHGAPIGC
jgi:murein DD-endopeptidase MepM/ murein hydrolase activator NlpD